MTISTLSGTVTSTVTLSASYSTATLVITAEGVLDTPNPFTLQGAAPLPEDYDIINNGLIEGEISLDQASGILQNNGSIFGTSAVFTGTTLQNNGFIGAPLRLLHGDFANAGTAAYGVAIYYGAFSNTGLITGAGTGAFINNDLFPSDTAQNSGTITGNGTGVEALDAGLVNQGLISGGTRGFVGNALDNQGIILGGTIGAYLLNTNAYASFALTNSGTIAGSFAGIEFDSPGQIYDTGTISGSYAIRAPGQALNLTLGPGAALYGQVRVGGGLAILEGALPGVNPASLRGFAQIEYLTSGAITGFINTGTFTQNPAVGVSLAGVGTLRNSGTLAASGTYHVVILPNADIFERYGGTGLIAAGRATIDNTGQISGIETGVSLAAGGTVLNAGIIGATGRYYRYLAYSGDGFASTISHGPATALYNAAGTLYLTVTPGAAFFGAVRDEPGAGTLDLAPGSVAGTLDIASFSGFAFVDFAASASWTLEGSTAQLATSELLTGFTLGDTIVLDDFAASSAQYYSGLGLILSNGTSFPMLHFAQGATSFNVTTDDASTTITAACFCRGTRIATPHGEVPVEDLHIDDEVQTLHAGVQRIKWIGRRSYTAPFSAGDFIRPIRIRPGALDDDIPRRALNLSPGHALFMDGALIPAWRLLNGASITQMSQAELVEYFHIELEAQEVIFAEGCPVETFIGTQLRGQFHNADEFLRLYPNAEDQAPCLTLLEDGFALEAQKTRIAQRAGLPPALPHTPGRLCGFVDIAGPDAVEGWAQDESAPETPIALDILRDNQRIGRVLANRFRADLREAGRGSGCHAFRFTLPPGPGPITVHRTTDHATLPLTDAAMRVA